MAMTLFLRLGVSRTQAICSLAAALAAGCAILVLGLFQTPVFVAKATLYFEEPENRSTSLNNLTAISSLIGLQADSQLWAEQEIGRIVSRTNLNRLIDKHDLKARLIEQKILRGRGDQIDDPEFVAKSLRNIIEFMPRSKSHWVELAVSTPDRALSQLIATTLLEDYAVDRRKELVGQSEVNLKYLRERVESERNLAIESVTVKLMAEEMTRALFLQSERGRGMQMVDAPMTSAIPKQIPIILIVAASMMLFSIVFVCAMLLSRWVNALGSPRT